MKITKAKIIQKLKKYTKEELLDVLEILEQKKITELELLPTNFKLEMGEIEALNSEHTEQAYYDGQMVAEMHEQELKEHEIFMKNNA